MELLEHIKDSVKKSVPDSNIGVAFSGGVDSTLIAKVCSDLGYNVTLLTVGFSDSHDILFSAKIGKILRLPHETLEIEPDTFAKTAAKVRDIIKTDNLSWNENSIAFHYIARLAHSIGVRMVVTANGIDELFCGYDAYRAALHHGESHVLELIRTKMKNEIRMMESIDAVAREHDVQMVQPLLEPEFAQYAMSLPMSEKIHSSDDLLRKHAIRNLARVIGVPELSAGKRKKALQYGSRIHKELLKTR